MKIGLVGNGDPGDLGELRKKLLTCDQVIAVDGGLRHLAELGLKPDTLVGDFDSISKNDLVRFSDVPQVKFPQDKDETDMALALKISSDLNPEKICLFAALGRRVDHTLANIRLLTLYPEKAFIETESETLYAIHGFHKQKSAPGQTVSFFSAGEKAIGVKTKGFKWELDGAQIDNQLYSLSNIALGENFEITVSSGTLIIVIQHV